MQDKIFSFNEAIVDFRLKIGKDNWITSQFKLKQIPTTQEDNFAEIAKRERNVCIICFINEKGLPEEKEIIDISTEKITYMDGSKNWL